MDAWNQITAGALIGTDRQPFAPPRIDGELGAALARIAEPSSPRGLMAAAALVGGYASAGRAAASSPKKPEPAPPDKLRRAPAALAGRLATLFTEDSRLPTREILAELFALMARHAMAVPHRMLPLVLDAGQRDRELRDFVAAVIDSRGRWLGAQRSDWGYAAGDGDDPKVWEEGPTAARVAFLRSLRKSDPDRARELLDSAWKRESAQDRLSFLGAFEFGLSGADEAFLEAALDDRGKEVRRLAARLLGMLPGSAFRARAIARASEVLHVESKLFRNRLVVTPPEALTPEAQRDGIGAEDPDLANLGEKGKWLYGTIAAIPPSHWVAALGKPPDELLVLARETDWELAIIAGWAAAARRHRDADWLVTLIQAAKSRERHYDKRSLVPALPPAELEAEARRIVAVSGGVDELMLRLEFLPAPWSAPLTIGASDALAKLTAAKGRLDYAMQEGLALLARRGHPDVYPEAAAWAARAAEADPQLSNTLDKFTHVYAFRHSMYKEVQS